ncbi:hypothetical protein acdb102_15540 [Acidothermaceae bacterium B102]|nr:hypothetical protein acdb102_15540 [Acidothermaceae bacterium B102]
MRNASHHTSRADRRVDGLMQLALVATLVLVASSLVRVAVTGFGYDPALDRLRTAATAQDTAGRAVLEMENGLRGYQLSADSRFLEPYLAGRRQLAAATVIARTNLVGYPDLGNAWDASVNRALAWEQRYAVPAINDVRPAGAKPSVENLLAGSSRLGEWQAAQVGATSAVADAIARERSSEDLVRTSTGVTQVMALLLLTYALVRRQRRPHESNGEAAAPRTPSVGGSPSPSFAVSGDLDELAVSIANAGREISGATAASLWLADGDDLRRVEPGQPIIIAQRRRHDVALRAHREGAITTSVSRSRRTLAVPLLHDGRTLGVVELTMPHGSGEPSHAQIEMLRAWGRQAAKAVAYGPGAADRDRLTGFSGRATLLADLATGVASSLAGALPVSLVVLEVDHLDRGTAAGTAVRDDLVRTIGSVLADTVRASDTAYRTGEGAFAVLLPGAPETAAASLAERLRQIIARRFVERGVTASFGVATCPDVAQDEAALLEAAEAALYDAQRFGGNRAQRAHSLTDELAMVRRRVSELD